MGTAMKSVNEKSHTEMYAGLALFFSMYYVLGANPEILSQIGIPASAALLGTFLAIIVGNLCGAFATNTGLMIAPAIGISAFVNNFVQHSDNKLDWRHAMLACALAGVLVFLTSIFTDWRERIVDDLPESVTKGAKAGIGALLIKEAFDIFEQAQKHGLEPRVGGIFVTLGVVFLVLFFLLRSKIEDSANNEPPIARFFMRLEFLLVVILMSSYLNFFQPSYIAALPDNTKLSFLWKDPIVFTDWHLHFVELILIFLFAATVWFIVISDIPGTPNEILPEDQKAVDGRKAVRHGYINDGVFAFLSPLIGTTPTIYYAENQILKSFGVYSRRVSLWATALFFIVFAIDLVGQLSPGWKIPVYKFLSPIAVLPIVIFIGLYIISVSFLQSPHGEGAAPPVSRSPQYYFPSAISVILTSRIGLEYALPLSVLSFWLVKSKDDQYGPSFMLISIGSAVSLVVFGCLFAGG
jgi:xanthine/uracil/vitamin C permease (AzgA family)